MLDIGSGCGFFPAVARYFGHRIVATDVDPDAPIFKDVRALFDQPIEELHVRAFERLPDHLTDFDMVTAFATCFNVRDLGENQMEHWSVPEWMFFLSDIRDRLNPGGLMNFDINKNPHACNGIEPELASSFRTIDGAFLRDTGGYFRLTLTAC